MGHGALQVPAPQQLEISRLVLSVRLTPFIHPFCSDREMQTTTDASSDPLRIKEALSPCSKALLASHSKRNTGQTKKHHCGTAQLQCSSPGTTSTAETDRPWGASKASAAPVPRSTSKRFTERGSLGASDHRRTQGPKESDGFVLGPMMYGMMWGLWDDDVFVVHLLNCSKSDCYMGGTP